VDRIRIVRPDVVLMDIDMPYVDGIAWLTLLKEAFPDLKVIMQIISWHPVPPGISMMGKARTT
jgi:DNA-binding NarL/FixJ family response regulator